MFLWKSHVWVKFTFKLVIGKESILIRVNTSGPDSLFITVYLAYYGSFWFYLSKSLHQLTLFSSCFTYHFKPVIPFHCSSLRIISGPFPRLISSPLFTLHLWFHPPEKKKKKSWGCGGEGELNCFLRSVNKYLQMGCGMSVHANNNRRIIRCCSGSTPKPDHYLQSIPSCS